MSVNTSGENSGSSNVAPLQLAPLSSQTQGGHPKASPGRVDILIDDETYEAGSGNIIVITLRNPFDVPISVIELKDPKSTTIRTNKPISDVVSQSRKQFFDGLGGLFNGFSSAITASIGFGGIKAQFGTLDRTLKVNSSGNAKLDISQVISQFDNVVINTTGDATLVASTPPDGEAVVRVIQPHCETNAFLTIDTKGWLFAKPNRLRLKSELRFRIDDNPTEYTQVVPLNFDVRPPLRAVVIGAISGALLGGIARFVNDGLAAKSNVLTLTLQDCILQLIKLGGAAIMAIIATIALSRKTGAQGFITVEDFFGGFVVGVLVAYQGPAYFERILSGQAGSPNGGQSIPGSVIDAVPSSR